ncbi:hypothetical protein L218DRAFT_1009201 [Marasmius fiardii PR-910]|nr:hypothetical protein L218DRAFT_1009201 [Marasmius fiardii PR-910]
MTLRQEFQLTTQPEIKVSPITSYINGGIIKFSEMKAVEHNRRLHAQKPVVPINRHVLHFAVKKDLYTLISKVGYLPPRIPADNALHFSSKNDLTPHLHEFNWIDTSTHPFLPLVPQWNVFRGPLFGCLDYRDGHFPYYQDGKIWRLAQEVVRKWDNLEYYLKMLVLAMLETAQADDSVMTSQFSLWSLPASYHYKKRHNSLQDLQKAAASSRDAFLPLIAAGTLGYRWCMHRERTRNDIGWRARLQNRYNIHPQWFDDFASSEANSPDVLRAGGIIDTRARNAPVLMQLYVGLNIPICLYWGEIGNSALGHKGTQKLPRLYLPMKRAGDDDQYHDVSRFFPEQEHYWGFYRAEIGEPAAGHDSRGNRLSPPLDHQPGRLLLRFKYEQCTKAATWTPITIHPWLNNILDNEMESRGKIFSSEVKNEWDICSEFGDPSGDSDFGGDDFDDDCNHLDQSYLLAEGAPAPVETGVDEMEGREMEDGEMEDGEMEDEGAMDVSALVGNSGEALRVITSRGIEKNANETLEERKNRIWMDEVGYERYGFNSEDVEEHGNQEPIDNTRMLLGNGRWQGNRYNAEFFEPDPKGKLRRFFYLLSRISISSTTIPNLPGCDITNEESYIHDANNWEIRVVPTKIESDDWYVVANRNRPLANQKMVLLVKDPVSVLQIVRCRWGPELSDIASQFVVLGIPFQTLIPGPLPNKPSQTQKAPPKPYLGHRKSDYKPDINDFRAYEQERDRFLTSS